MSDPQEPPRPPKRDLRAEIDANLRRAYAEALEQEIPSRFIELLARLRAQSDRTED